MVCKKCGKTIEDNSVFCEFCGERVDIKSADEKVVENTSESSTNLEEKNTNKDIKQSKKKTVLIVSIIIAVVAVIIIVMVCAVLFLGKFTKDNKDNKGNNIVSEPKTSEYRMSGNSLENFDLYFLQLENEKENKIYSPLSIKYALAMLNEGTEGNSKRQISSLIGDYKAKKYINSKNMSLANALFINTSLKKNVKSDYAKLLIDKYNAEVIFDSFTSADNINSWISDKTLKLIDNAVENLDREEKFLLVNALAIDMEWEQKFIHGGGYTSYSHEKFSWSDPDNVSKSKFNRTQEISGMEIVASLNNYDIVRKLGEDKIRETVGDAFRKYLSDNKDNDADYYLNGDYSEININKVVEEYLDEYIKEINTNYKRIDKTTDFSLYVDDDVKVFAKNLKEYNGTTLQYIGIMPTKESLDQFISNTDSKKINNIIDSLKELKLENFKDGVVTKITGYIPKFKFDYELDLQSDLEELGITDIFDKKKANLSGITSSKDAYLGDATHKANIEFTQDGIKAAAVTIMGGMGAASFFDYFYDVPVEEIDLTFDKPYMFLIRDKETGEVWFVGTVYEPLDWEDEPEKDNVW